nr:hypothetical protein [Tanacetum cinerariifolium]
MVCLDLFAFINHADPTKVRLGEKQIEEGQTSLLDSTRGRVVLLAGVNEQGNQNDNVQDVDAHVVQDEEVNIVDDEEVKATVADKPKGTRKKRKTASGASDSVLPPKRLREDNGTSGDADASTTRKSLVVNRATTSRTDCGTIADATSASVHESCTKPVQRSIFRDSASPSTVGADVAGPYQPAGAEVCRSMVDQLTLLRFFSQLWSMDYDQFITEFNVGVARQACFSVEVRLRSEHNYMEKKMLERRCQRRVDLLKEKDIEIADLKAQLSLKEAEA